MRVASSEGGESGRRSLGGDALFALKGHNDTSLEEVSGGAQGDDGGIFTTSAARKELGFA